ncbi:MAG: prepilin-type N-terminal cleavage/methylation domain-containing protein [Phycisphaerae bacterium]|jgi:prepilin-type N-terminal cleavage/methylation domain-containing protein|nr:prepilin-type N-terminal cleavage/methylation domain-containing protein [Phycisphaerae bacterium]
MPQDRTANLRFRRRQARRGFTLIETALATVIVGVGVLAMISAQQAFHQKNQWSTQASIAMRLGNEIRELTLNMPRHDPVVGSENWGPEENEDALADFDDLDDFDGEDGEGTVFSDSLGNGPISSRREVIPNMDGWSQTVRVFNVEQFDTTTAVDDGASEFMKVEVTIHFQGPNDETPLEMTKVSWLARK